MPTKNVSEIGSVLSLAEDSLLESSKINAYDAAITRKKSAKLTISPRTEFAMRQANHLVERICRDHGVEAPNISFAKCLQGREDQIALWSHGKHDSVLRLAEYMHKRGQIERDYSLSIQKLNRQIMQSEDTDDRLGQLIVMGEKTATSHMDFARKIDEERIVDDLKIVCGENDDQRRILLGDIRKLRAIWTKAVGAFEKVRKNRDKSSKLADSAQLALDNAVSRGNVNKNTLIKLEDEVNQKLEKSRVACEEYNRAISGLTKRQNEIFKERIPQCLDGFEKMERSRISAVRASLINLAQVNFAIANVEIESGQQWLKSLVSISVDDEIEIFVRDVEELGNVSSREINLELEEQAAVAQELDVNFEAAIEVEINEAPTSPTRLDNNKLYINSNLTNSESDLLTASIFCGLEENVDPKILRERKRKIETIQVKLRQQLEALERMEQAYNQQEQANNSATLEAVRSSKRVILREIEENANLFVQIELRLASFMGELKEKEHQNNLLSDHVNPMTSILAELNKLDQRRGESQYKKTSSLEEFHLKNKQETQSKTLGIARPPKKSLSRSFEEILKEDGESNCIGEVVASPKATGLKLPGAQWTAAAISRSNEEINAEINSKGRDDDFYCLDEEKEKESVDDKLMTVERSFRSRLGSAGSDKSSGSTGSSQFPSEGRRKSIGQSTKNDSASPSLSFPISKSALIEASKSKSKSDLNSPVMIPQNNQELYKVQALYNFIGRKETDELDLRVGEILSIFEGSGEWWEAENEAGVRGYIPFNYVKKL